MRTSVLPSENLLLKLPMLVEREGNRDKKGFFQLPSESHRQIVLDPFEGSEAGTEAYSEFDMEEPNNEAEEEGETKGGSGSGARLTCAQLPRAKLDPSMDHRLSTSTTQVRRVAAQAEMHTNHAGQSSLARNRSMFQF